MTDVLPLVPVTPILCVILFLFIENAAIANSFLTSLTIYIGKRSEMLDIFFRLEMTTAEASFL